MAAFNMKLVFDWKGLLMRLLIHLLQQVLEELMSGNPGDKDNGDRGGEG